MADDEIANLSGLQLQRHWDFEQAIENISDTFRPGSQLSGRARNAMVEAWGQLVGRERALACLDLALRRSGSISTLAKNSRATVPTIRRFRSFFERLPRRPTSSRLEAGISLGGWMLSNKLGHGGNAEVWKAISLEGQEAAIKAVPRNQTYKSRRLANEIKVLRALGQQEGILPLVESSSDDNNQQFEWYAMPIATPLEKITSEAISTYELITPILELSAALVLLHSRDVTHRDIKPPNLFEYRGKWVFGDFGIASFPEKEALTQPGSKLGPMYYISPEMLRSPERSDGKPADVYSFAKSIWVILSGQKYPFFGEHRLDLDEFRLASWTSLPNSDSLDSLLADAVRHEPYARPTAAVFHERLQNVLEEIRLRKN